MQSVCIIGAGPAGLAAAKIFLQTGKFVVTVYEKNDRIGGIWALHEEDYHGFLHPQTPTNLSRFTVAFSDLDWNSVDVSSKANPRSCGERGGRRKVPMFPKAWQVNRYLDHYRQKFIPADCIVFKHEVTHASLDRGERKWHITTRSSKESTETKTFDYLAMASGFFSRPRALRQDVQGLSEVANDRPTAIKSIHSSQFKTLQDLFPDNQNPTGKTILLVGGGNSVGEAAAAVAMQLCDTQWSPDTTQQKRFQDCRILHISPRHLYPLPPFVESEPGARSYVPIDMRLYDFAKRPPGPIESYAGQQSPEVRDIVHGALKTFVGGDQSDLGCAALVAPSGREKRTVGVALSETYPEFVRSGLIEVVKGRVVGIEDFQAGNATATVKVGEEMMRFGDIGAVVYATGYTPSPALEFLADDVKKHLQYDARSMRLPIILEQWQTMHPAVPELSFLGFYEGPYWPIIEMQARVTAERWLHGSVAATKAFEEGAKLLDLRSAMREKSNDVPQYWFGDYLGYMEDMARHLGLKKNDGDFKVREGCTSPARYLDPRSDVSVNEKIMGELRDTWRGCLDSGQYVPRAVFRALQGHWIFTRQLVSPDQNLFEVLEGRASFHPRYPTSDATGKQFDFEYLYIEEGASKPANGLIMTDLRRYVYRYSETDDQLSVWSVKSEGGLEADYLFHNLVFELPTAAREAGACIAKGEIFCVDDMYSTQYRFPMKGITLLEFETQHTVKWSNKDYVATTKYRRSTKTVDNRSV